MSNSAKGQQKSSRVLACIRCQQRKVKCDRNYPCSNCVRVGAQDQCTPASLNPRQRRRRFPERLLLERLRRYEDLLRQNNISFEPLHPSDQDDPTPGEAVHGSNQPAPTSPVPTTVQQTKNETSPSEGSGVDIWQAMNQVSSDDEDGEEEDEIDITRLDDASKGKIRSSTVRKALDQLFHENDLLLFGSSKADVPLATLHPSHVHIFRLWQIYLDNVNPLLKVTHTPTLQTRLLDAAADVTSISPPLEALMFSIYCVAIVSLQDEECMTLFSSPKSELLSSYQLACQQALQNCRIVRTTDLECLTALFLYFVSVRSTTDPRSLGTLLGMAIRLAQRIGIHTESMNMKCRPFEAEQRRRLWWAMVLFDNRICEMSDVKATTLEPTWTCRTPSNVNDFDIRAEMTSLPPSHRIPTEALYAVVSSELGNYARHSTSYLDCNGPTRHTWGERPLQPSRTLDDIETALENKYFALCNPENPIHFMTMWTARGFLAKYRLYEHYSRTARSNTPPTEHQRDTALIHAITILNCDTRLAASPLVKGFLWQLYFNFPFPSYMHIVSDLKKRPLAEPAERAWKAMSENCAARFTSDKEVNLGFKLFSKPVLQSWEAREEALRGRGMAVEVPGIVADVRWRRTGQTPKAQGSSAGEQDAAFPSIDLADFEMPNQMDFSYGLPGMDPLGMDVDLNQFFDWDPTALENLGMGAQ